MKINRTNILPGITIILFLASCDHAVEMHTKVGEDGNLEKKIVLIDAEPKMAETNFLGISEDTGWEVKSGEVSMGKYEGELQIAFSREFSSVDEANAELNVRNDTLFQIESTFEKKFRWFYTYMNYSETYKGIDRFNYINQADYFSKEEYDFIDRLPGIGGSISKADSLNLDLLNDKIYDIYGSRGMYEEIYHFWEECFEKYGKDVAILKTNKESLYELFTDEEADIEYDEDEMYIDIFDSLGISFPKPEVYEDIRKFNDAFEAYLEFASWAGDGQFINQIEMPWTIVETNADTVDMNTAIWRPSPMKYLLSDYTMQVTARKMNIWAVLLSIVVIVASALLIIRSRRKDN